ncbi:hypothetical protein K439DRAFT_38734 [Ramaria rubella]|nr:hypothetical protein K439DRAFT_38734 [Ramaria rubella]
MDFTPRPKRPNPGCGCGCISLISFLSLSGSQLNLADTSSTNRSGNKHTESKRRTKVVRKFLRVHRTIKGWLTEISLSEPGTGISENFQKRVTFDPSHEFSQGSLVSDPTT